MSQPPLDARVTRPIAQHHAVGKDDAPGGFFEGATEKGAFGPVAEAGISDVTERHESGAHDPDDAYALGLLPRFLSFLTTAVTVPIHNSNAIRRSHELAGISKPAARPLPPWRRCG